MHHSSIPVWPIVLLVALTAPGFLAAQDPEPNGQDSGTVIVENRRIDPVTVSVWYRPGGKRRIGRVNGNQRREFRFAWRDAVLRLVAKIEGYREHVSNDLVPRPGELLQFTVQPSFQPISLRSLGQDTTGLR